jgi:hypothetical protein
MHSKIQPTPLLLTFLLVLAGSFQSMLVRAQEGPLSDSAFVSLITVSPGEEIYAHYGHTAIRVADPKNGFDLVFNYGLFDFNSPNFIFRFVKGETDYICGAFDYDIFLMEYQGENRQVTEQIINLKPEEKEAVWQALVKNSLPENRTYRYNFFFNNCSTKPRDVVVKGVQGKVDYRTKGYYPSLRSVIHHYTENHPWTQFGIDFLIGAQADKPASLSDQQFAPELLEATFATAVVKDSTGKIRPLVLVTRQAVSQDVRKLPKPSRLPGPVPVAWFLCLAMAACTWYEFRKGIHFQAVTAVLYSIFGITGSIIAFLVLFSIHPTTHVNYLLLWQNPFHLIFAFGMIFESFRKKFEKSYLSLNWKLQLLALVGIWIFPQHLHPAMLPLLLMMLMRSTLGVRKTN